MTAFTIAGRSVELPCEVRHADAYVSSFLVPARAAAELTRPAGLQPIRPAPGKAMANLVMMRYVDGDLGPYHEFGLTFLVKPPDGSGKGGMRDLVRNDVGAYIHHLPVDSEFSRQAGVDIWGFPKYMTDSVIVDEPLVSTGTVWHEDKHVLTLRIATFGVTLNRSGKTPPGIMAYSFHDGVLRRTPWTMRLGKVRWRPGGAEVSLGTGRFADDLRLLGFPRHALTSAYAPAAAATFGEAEVVSF